MNIYKLLIISFLLLRGGGVNAQLGADKILGIYLSPAKDAKIELYKKAGKYFGKTIWLQVAKKDDQNPDKSLRQRELVGLDLFTSFKYDDGIYSGGEIYDPTNGKTYSCKISFAGVDLKVRGYIGISLFGRTELFQRIK